MLVQIPWSITKARWTYLAVPIEIHGIKFLASLIVLGTKRLEVVHKSILGPTLDQVPIVCEYPDVFPDELPGMPPDRDIEFIIELIPRTGPIAQRPYRMNPVELVELKKQLDVMQRKGLIQPSSSSWRSQFYLWTKVMVPADCALITVG
jgi:hypothetical protein